MQKRCISKPHQEIYEKSLQWIVERKATPGEFTSRLRSRFSKLEKPQAFLVLKLIVGEVEIRKQISEEILGPRALSEEVTRQTAMLTTNSSAHRTFAMKVFVDWVQFISENKSKLPPDSREYPSLIAEGKYTMDLEFEQ